MCVLFDLGRILLTVFYVYTHCAAVYLERKDPTCQLPRPGQCPGAIIAQPKKAAPHVPPLSASSQNRRLPPDHSPYHSRYRNRIRPSVLPTAKPNPTGTTCQQCSTPNTKLGFTATDPSHRCLKTPMMLGDCSMCHDSAPITQCRYLMAPEKKSTPLYWAGIPHHHARAKTAT